MKTRFVLSSFLVLLAPAVSTAAELPILRVTQDDVRITESCIIEIPTGAVLPDLNGNGVIHIVADNLVVRFQAGSVLQGAAPDTPWNELTGIGVRVDGVTNVTVQAAHVHGFKNGVVATRADGLTIAGGDFSDNYRQRLKSTPTAEDSSDWMFPHNNDQQKWRDQYGGAVCLEHSSGITIHDIVVRRGQNGIILDHVNDSAVFDNDCSFLSGWGLAMWKSSRNMISRNAFDFCVRGHVEGVYNRGQDSAGILCFEQCNDNVFAENSATHGGDGFFGFGGKEAIGDRWMERERERLRKETGKQDVDDLIEVPEELARRLSALGCNRNLLIGNDFSYAPAHGIEMTFSEGNRFVRNRVVENAICGVWGGYSSDTLIAENEFVGNGGMAYGLERGAINMEHAAKNVIVKNRFLNNRCGVHLWWDDDRQLLRQPGVAGGEQRVVGNVIAGNEFEINAQARFTGLRQEDQLIVLQFRDPMRGSNVFDNAWFSNTVELSHPRAIEFALDPGCEPAMTGIVPQHEIPSVEIRGNKRTVGARKELRGRNKIVMDEWGPWDHASPLVRSGKDGANGVAYELFGVNGLKTPKMLEGNVSLGTRAGASESSQVVTVTGEPGVSHYRITLVGDGFKRELTGTIVIAEWQAKFFPWKIDPREDLDGWRKLADGSEAVSVTVSGFDFPYGWGGPKDQKLGSPNGFNHLGADHFGMIAKTSLKLPKGRWLFKTVSDDGIRVEVAGKTVIENWTWHGPTPNEGYFEQTEDGQVDIVVEHFEIDGYSTLKLEIEGS